MASYKISVSGIFLNNVFDNVSSLPKCSEWEMTYPSSADVKFTSR